jgi:hypothetical protein
VAAGSGGRGGRGGHADARLESAILRRFQEGAPPVDVAIELEVSLDRVATLHSAYKRSVEEKRPSLADEVRQLRAELDGVNASLSAAITQLEGMCIQLTSDRDSIVAEMKRRTVMSCTNCKRPIVNYYCTCTDCASKGF